MVYEALGDTLKMDFIMVPLELWLGIEGKHVSFLELWLGMADGHEHSLSCGSYWRVLLV